MRLQTILFPTENICGAEELYFHRRGKWIDFDGYFNLFYIEKRKKYSRLDGLSLVLHIEGAQAVRLMHDREILAERTLEGLEQEGEYVFELPYHRCESGVFWFSLKVSEAPGESGRKWPKVRGFFDGNVTAPRPVSIAAVICTYRREAYVIRNLACLKEIFENTALEAASHLQVFLVDNGQTLEENAQVQQLKRQCGGRVLTFKNPNAGGAGGFTRGMLEALKRREAKGLTHVLLMDDDAVFEPDLFVRLYGFLAALKEEYSSITVGGNLLREDFPYLLHAGGERFKDFKIHNDHVLTDLRDFDTCTQEFFTRAEYDETLYSGWWCCCFSLETVREDNLPIPLFLHFDDIEYCLRNAENGLVFLNGIGVWHKGFEWNFTGANRYYDVRNSLIAAALLEPDQRPMAVKKWVWRNMITPFLEFRYGESYLAYRGLLDFCKGPKWLFEQDPDRLNRKVRGCFGLEPFEALKGQLAPEEYEEAARQARICRSETGPGEIRAIYAANRRRGHFFKKFTWNGWFLPPKKERKISLISAVDIPYKAFRKKRLVLFEPASGKALLAVRDYGELKKLLRNLLRAGRLVDYFYPKAAREYRERLSEITSASAWKKYLGLEDHE